MAGVRVYRNARFQGRSAYWDHPQGYRYDRVWQRTLKSHNLNNAISSLRVYAGEDERQTVLLFDKPHFKGGFVGLKGMEPSRNVAGLKGARDFENRTSSILQISHAEVEKEFHPLAIGALAGPDATAALDEVLDPMPEATRGGDVVFTWDLWPDFDSAKKFIRVDAPLRVKVPMGTYKARVTFYLYLYVDVLHHLRGYVNWTEVWVQSGPLRGRIHDALDPEAQNAAGMVEGLLNDVLTELNYHEWSSYYLMPGIAPADRPTDYKGDVEEDVTLILVRR